MNRLLESFRTANARMMGMLLLSAVLGSGLTVGMLKLAEGRKPLVIEHRDGTPAVQSSYTADGSPVDFTYAAEKAMPSVVHIKSTQLRSSGRTLSPGVPDIFRDFFGDEFFSPSPGGSQPSVGTGSGVIISADGYIITNNHVIDGASDIEVSLSNNQTYKAEVVGVDPSTDIAVIKVEADGLTAIPFGNSDQVRVGEWVLAIGNPFNLNSTVTAGIVSAKSRNINILRDRAAIESFIQTDAAINPGNSGGALVNLAGELIGINTAIASPTGSYSGYGFAVPVVLVRKIVEDLVQYGTVQRGYLGATIRSLDGNLAREKGLNLTEGVYVDSLLANSAAEEAGIKSGDIITAVDGKTVKSSSDLLAAVGARRPGDKVAVVLSRKGQTREVTVVLKNRAGNTDIVKKSETGALNKLGAEFETLAPEVARKLGLEGGVRVSSLSAGKLSQSTQIRTGFIITHVDGKRIRNVEELDSALDGKSGGVMLEGFYENNLARKYYYGFGLD